MFEHRGRLQKCDILSHITIYQGVTTIYQDVATTYQGVTTIYQGVTTRYRHIVDNNQGITTIYRPIVSSVICEQFELTTI